MSTSGEIPSQMKTSGNGTGEPIPDTGNVAQFQPAANPGRSRISSEEQAALDEEEKLLSDTVLDDEDGDDPGDSDEISKALVVKKLPRFAIFRSRRMFDMWGTSDQQGMDEVLYVTTKSFAPNFEDDVELRRYRFFETVTTDGVVRLIWCAVPEKAGRQPNNWVATKLGALEHAEKLWTTMRSRSKQAQYTFRRSRKQAEYGEPKFSGRSVSDWVLEIKKQGMLVDSRAHEFFQRATDSE